MSESLYTNFYWAMNQSGQPNRDEHTQKLVPWLIWKFQKSMNEYGFKGIDFAAQKVVRKAKEYGDEWGKIRSLYEWRKRKNQHEPNGEMDASFPRQLKYNCDGAWPKEEDKCDIGWILKDHIGEVKWIGVRTIPRLRSAVETESEQGLRWVIKSITGLGYTKVIFKTDSNK